MGQIRSGLFFCAVLTVGATIGTAALTSDANRMIEGTRD
jgi:hypothetical protein